MSVQAPLFSDNLGFQDWMVDNTSGYELPYPFTNMAHHPFQVNEPSSSGLLISPQALSSEIERQSREIDLFLHLQSERLKHAIHEQKRQQLSAMLISMESKASTLMRKAEQDMAEAAAKARKLEESLRRAEMEAEVWERMARENEAMISGLNNMLGQAQERMNWASRPNNECQAQDAESACEAENDKMGCKWCGKRVSCVVLLPCRHLCACRECGSLLAMCPVCHCVTEGVIEVLLG
ncbi:hypothetical protein V2J09_017198 [Rumex salicifolius]